jgi:hypothetical protein
MESSYESLRALTARIFDDRSQIAASGIELRGWGPNREKTAVAAQVAGDAAVAQQYMDEAYGPGRVVVSHSDRPLPERY